MYISPTENILSSEYFSFSLNLWESCSRAAYIDEPPLLHTTTQRRISEDFIRKL
jgi:hypothetical protein